MKPIYKKYLTMWSLLWGGSLVAFILVYMFLLAPQKDNLQLLKGKLKNKTQKRDIAKALDNEQSRNIWLKKAKTLEEKLEDFVICPNDLDNLAFGISKIAGQMGLLGFSTTATRGKNFYNIPDCEKLGYVLLEVEFNSSFNEFAKFLNALERYRPIVLVDEFIITQAHEGIQQRIAMVLNILVKIPQEKQTKKTRTGG